MFYEQFDVISEIPVRIYSPAEYTSMQRNLWKSTNFFGVRIHNTDQQCYEFWVNDVIPSSICVAQNDEKSVIDTPNLLVDQPKTTAVYS